MSGLLALATPRRIKASHRRRGKIASGQSVQRYYDPQIGRFLSVDPVTANSVNGSNFNRYWYANDNPYKFTDPDGRFGDWLDRLLGINTDKVGGQEQVNQHASEVAHETYAGMKEPFVKAAGTAGNAVNKIDSVAKVSVEGTLAEGGAVRGSLDVVRGQGSVGIAPIAGQGARLAVTVSPRAAIQVPFLPNASEAKGGVSMPLFEAHVVEGVGFGLEVSQKGGYLEFTPKIEFGVGAEFIKYPSVEFEVGNEKR